jgi:hypothetical protein
LIVDFLSDEGVRSVGSEKFWPKPQPAAVSLGPCVEQIVAGEVLLKARRITRRQFASTIPPSGARFWVEAFIPPGTAEPRYVSPLVGEGEVTFTLTGEPVGPAGAYAVRLQGG